MLILACRCKLADSRQRGKTVSTSNLGAVAGTELWTGGPSTSPRKASLGIVRVLNGLVGAGPSQSFINRFSN